jgi:hypothetical protein
MKSAKQVSKQTEVSGVYRSDEVGFVIRPRLPAIDGIFDLGPDVLIASHSPHRRIREHLHDHLYYMHIR